MVAHHHLRLRRQQGGRVGNRHPLPNARPRRHPTTGGNDPLTMRHPRQEDDLRVATQHRAVGRWLTPSAGPARDAAQDPVRGPRRQVNRQEAPLRATDRLGAAGRVGLRRRGRVGHVRHPCR